MATRSQGTTDEPLNAFSGKTKPTSEDVRLAISLIYASYKDDPRLTSDLMHIVKAAFRDCNAGELAAMVDPSNGLASRCSWPPTLYDIATFRKERREKLGEQIEFDRRHGGAPDKSVSDEWRAHKQERLNLAREVWPDAWIDWNQKDSFGKPGAIVSGTHRIAVARNRQRQEWTPFRPYPQLWEAFANEPFIISKLENKLPADVRGFEALRNAHKTHPCMTFDHLTAALNILRAKGVDAAREYILKHTFSDKAAPSLPDTWSVADLKTPPAPPRSKELRDIADQLRDSEGL